jgi:hypothetical protein
MLLYKSKPVGLFLVGFLAGSCAVASLFGFCSLLPVQVVLPLPGWQILRWSVASPTWRIAMRFCTGMALLEVRNGAVC